MAQASASNSRQLANRSFSVPGKTFLIGEYVATDGGPSLLLATEPRFELRVRSLEHHQEQATSIGGSNAVRKSAEGVFHPDSPAGLYLKKYADDFAGLSFEFFDPHEGLGGLGASSAQFVLLMADRLGLDLGTEKFPWSELLAEYRACAWNGQGIPPSGADVVTHVTGGVTWFDGRAARAEKLAWNFETLGFTLIRTGKKLATHEHLRSGGLAPHQSLRRVVEEGRKAFDTNDELRLIEAVQACAHVLREAGLTAPSTLDLLETMRQKRELFYAVKGCGAMGADVILALHEKSKEAEVENWVNEQGLKTCGQFSTLSHGLEPKLKRNF